MDADPGAGQRLRAARGWPSDERGGHAGGEPPPFDAADEVDAAYGAGNSGDPCGADDADDADDGDAIEPAAPPGAAGARGEAALAARAPAGAVPEATLAQWIEAVAGQDEGALAALYDATCTRVFGLVRRIVRSAALAEEVVEDTYFQLWRQAPRFDPGRGSALAWVLAMARSRAIDALRHEARFRHEELGDAGAADGAAGATQGAAAAPPADELLDLARRHAALHRALMQLGAQPRQLVSLAFFRGLTHEEIAEQTRLPLGTVKAQIRRALLVLRRVLGDGGALRGLA